MRAIRPKEEPSASPTTSPHTVPPFPNGDRNGSTSGDARENKRRKCISSACLPCRKRKSKCDGSTPFCSTCTAVYKTPCAYDIDSDHRRKAALKRDLQALEKQHESKSIILAEIQGKSESDALDIFHMVRAGEDLESIAEGLRREQGSGEEESDVKNVEGALSMDEKGVKRHFGHTSNLGLVTHQDHPILDQTKTEEWTTVTRDPELVNHLLNLYFSWVHPYYGTFSREAFYMSLQDGSNKYCSQLLLNSILAVACHYSDRPDVRTDPVDPNTAGNAFFDEAKWLLFQDESSRLTTVQALGLMSVREICAGRDSPGYAYIARAAHMALELGLHLKFEGNAQTMNNTEAEVRKITFWSLFHYETCWAIALGRPTQLPNSAINVDRPRIVEQYDNEPWCPYIDYDSMSGPGAGQPRTTSTFQDQIYALSEIINDMVVAFYAPRERFTSRKLLEFYKKYQSWHENLPPVLALHQNTLPHVLSLHMYYNTCLIHLFRAFIKVTLIRSTVSPRTVCSTATGEIGRIFALYRQTYTLRRSSIINSHVILTSSIIDLINLPHNATAAAHLAQAIEIMREASIQNLFYTRDLVVLLALAKQWAITLPPAVEQAAFCHRSDLPPPNNRPIQSSAYLPTQSAFHFFPPQPSNAAAMESAPEIQYYSNHQSSADIPHIHPPLIDTTHNNAAPATSHGLPPTATLPQPNPYHPQPQQLHPTIPAPPTTTTATPTYTNHPNAYPAPTSTTTPAATTPSTSGVGQPTLQHQHLSTQSHFFWSPLPDQGLPLQNNVSQRGSTMDIARVVDDMGGWDQLSRDGFKMAEGEDAWAFDAGALGVGGHAAVGVGAGAPFAMAMPGPVGRGAWE